jgi:small subunit ribosomal protein S1
LLLIQLRFTGQLLFVKERQRAKKLAARVQRPVPLSDRTPLAALVPGMNVTGLCISHTAFGAYVDIGTECDGLLHIAQMSPSGAFVSHPRQVVMPGEEIAVTVRSINPSLKKLHLTMLPWSMVQEQLQNEQRRKLHPTQAGSHWGSDNNSPEEEDRIPLTDIQVDDELWGELKRVTDFGAYVEVGAAVDGFLHFMDHPAFLESTQRRHPTEFMQRGTRVRVWVSDVDLEQGRIKLTAHRPSHLPGPRRENQYYD